MNVSALLLVVAVVLFVLAGLIAFGAVSGSAPPGFIAFGLAALALASWPGLP